MEKFALIDYIFHFQLIGAVIYATFLLLLAIGLRRLTFKSLNGHQPFVSVVIAARNEEKNIHACLQHLMQQNYPRDRYEVIVVDDHSDDATYSITKSFAMDRVKLFSLNSTDGMSPKKAALHKGIEESCGEIILTTDADCRAPATWIETIVKYFDEKTGAVASWLCVEENNHLLSKLETLDSLALSFIGAASFGWKKPFMANGANFAYRRQVYDELNGFAGVAEYVSGDDDLLLQKIRAAQNWECVFAPDADATIVTNSNATLSDFFEQRFRWASKSRIYPKSLLLLQVCIYFYFLSFLFTVLIFLVKGFFSAVYLAPLALKFLFDFLFMSYAARRLQKKINPFVLFTTEWLQIFYVIIVGVWGLWGSYTWKGRRYSKGRVR